MKISDVMTGLISQTTLKSTQSAIPKINLFLASSHMKWVVGTAIIEFVSLRSKMYSIQAHNTNKKTVKEILSIAKEKEIRHEDFKTTLFSAEHKQTWIV